jgi:hypothetical protein
VSLLRVLLAVTFVVLVTASAWLAVTVFHGVRLGPRGSDHAIYWTSTALVAAILTAVLWAASRVMRRLRGA